MNTLGAEAVWEMQRQLTVASQHNGGGRGRNLLERKRLRAENPSEI